MVGHWRIPADIHVPEPARCDSPGVTQVQELRNAAAKISALAMKATPGPWAADHPDYPETIYGNDGNTSVISGGRWGGEANVFDNNDDAYHIALWNPAIAVLVADWLIGTAAIAEAGFRPVSQQALDLARTINATEVA